MSKLLYKIKNESYNVVDAVFRNIAFITIALLIVQLWLDYLIPLNLRILIIPIIIFGLVRLWLE